MTETNDK